MLLPAGATRAPGTTPLLRELMPPTPAGRYLRMKVAGEWMCLRQALRMCSQWHQLFAPAFIGVSSHLLFTVRLWFVCCRFSRVSSGRGDVCVRSAFSCVPLSMTLLSSARVDVLKSLIYLKCSFFYILPWRFREGDFKLRGVLSKRRVHFCFSVCVGFSLNPVPQRPWSE